MEIVLLRLKKPFLSTDIKLILVVFIILTIGFFSLYLVYDFGDLANIYKSKISEDTFFAQDFNDNSTVFILGTSSVGVLDPYYIEEKLSKNDLQVSVYNLARGSDSPHNRILEIDKIISKKPDLVIYGIDYNNLAIYEGPIYVRIFGDQKPSSVLPDIHDTIYYGLKLDRFFL